LRETILNNAQKGREKLRGERSCFSGKEVLPLHYPGTLLRPRLRNKRGFSREKNANCSREGIPSLHEG